VDGKPSHTILWISMIHREKTDPGYWQERQMVARVHALRHLPPDTWLPQSDLQPDRDLLAGLLNLEDGSDPLEWLKENHGELASRVLLWTTLDRIRSIVKGMRLADLAWYRVSVEGHRHWLANLLELPEEVDSLRKIANTHPTTVSPELLQSVLQKLRSLRRETSPLPAAWAGSDELIPIQPLLVDLFQLAEATDPLQWIQDERGHLAAIATLAHILDQVRPPHPMLLGPEIKIEHPLKVYLPNTRLRAEGLSLVLREVALGKTSFTLRLQTRIPERLLRITFMPGRRIAWEGIDRVVDNLGYHYVVWHHLYEGGTHWRAYNLSLLLVCYPAIAPAANEITFSSDHMTVLVIDRGDREQTRSTFHQVFLGDLAWRIRISD
jgi:hypothetical protein